jgi:AP2-associated kinase
MTETEILFIFETVCKAVYHMHSLEPPIAHRDLKVKPPPITTKTPTFFFFFF